MTEKTYLGDGVYLEYVDGAILKLTTEDGVQTTNTIWLEWETYHALLRFVETLRANHAKAPVGTPR
jgi:hypothetical protein